jgi:uncharacterized damage-inducible protein DinB
MSIAEALIPEFDMEMATTRRVLERVPEDKFSFSPHEKSMTLQGLTTHLANLPSWFAATILEDSLDLSPKDGVAPKAGPVESAKSALEIFDGHVTAGRKALAGASDETLMSDWSLLSGGEVIFTQPKLGVIRSFVLNHMIHHRGQMSVYLRLNDVPVPTIYGPTADES